VSSDTVACSCIHSATRSCPWTWVIQKSVSLIEASSSYGDVYAYGCLLGVAALSVVVINDRSDDRGSNHR
jgi:hypothetical protein